MSAHVPRAGAEDVDRAVAAAAKEMSHLLLPNSGDPVPLYCEAKNFGVIWSPKSGCTMAVLWLFGHTNLLDAQKLYNPWPHRFRFDVLLRSQGYLDAVRRAVPEEIDWVRIIRDPYKRAVSSYRQAVGNGYDDAHLSAFLGRAVDPEHGFSFREYIDWLVQAERATTNPHEHPQRHRLEELVTPRQVINIDRLDIWAALREFERTACVPPMSDYNSELLRREVARVGRYLRAERAPMRGAAEIRMSKAARPRTWPHYADYLAPDIKAAIERIYAIDFESYGAVL